MCHRSLDTYMGAIYKSELRLRPWDSQNISVNIHQDRWADRHA